MFAGFRKNIFIFLKIVFCYIMFTMITVSHYFWNHDQAMSENKSVQHFKLGANIFTALALTALIGVAIAALCGAISPAAAGGTAIGLGGSAFGLCALQGNWKNRKFVLITLVLACGSLMALGALGMAGLLPAYNLGGLLLCTYLLTFSMLSLIGCCYLIYRACKAMH